MFNDILICMNLISEKDASLLNPLYLAFVGDAVWSYNIRAVLLIENVANYSKAGEMHSIATSYECASFQNEIYRELESTFTPLEKDIVKHARNAHNNNVPKSTTLANYKRATAIEALIGFWHLTGNLGRINAALNVARMKEIQY